MVNFPNIDDVYRAYLKSDIELSRLKEQCESKLKDYNDLRQLSETSIGNLSFEDLFLPYDFAESVENYKNLDDSKVDEILEKYVILKYIVSDGPFKYLENNVGYFDYTIFGSIIGNKYKSIEHVVEKLSAINVPYKKLFDDFQNAEINKILNFSKDARKSSKFISTFE